MSLHKRISNAGLHFIANWEGCKTEPYVCSGGKLTVGIGHVIKPDEQKLKKGITVEQAHQIFLKDIARFEIGVDRMVRVQISQAQFDALVSFAFNVGLNALEHSTLIKKLNARQYAGAADEFLRWDNAGGKHVEGLARRRKAERELFLSKPAGQAAEAPPARPADPKSTDWQEKHI